MINKKIMVLAIFLVSLLAISAVSAASDSTNDTFSTDTNNNLILQEINDENLILGSELEEIQSMGSAQKSLTDLHNLINVEYAANDTIFLNDDYAYCNDSDGEFEGGVVIDRALTIYGNGNTIDGSHYARIFSVTNSSVVFDNITFINANGKGNGGAITGECTVKNSQFINNTAVVYGGAIYLGNAYNCLFINNTAIRGGAIYSGNAYDCVFTENSAKSWGGGAMYGGSATNSIFIHNTASLNYGGAICCSSNNCLISNCSFINNTALDGGAISSNGFSFQVYNCNFTNNRVTNNGGAIYWSNSNASIYNCNFTNNRVTNNGGAIYCSSKGNSNIHGCNFTINHALMKGGAIYCDGDDCQVSDCNFSGNDANQGGAIYCRSGNAGIGACDFINNTAVNDGGAIFFANNGALTDCNFMNNSAKNGGAIYFNGDINNVTVIGCFKGNNAERAGGAIYVKGKSMNNNFSSQFYDNNARNASGGAIFFYSLAENNSFESIFMNNYALYGGGIFFYKNANDNKFDSNFTSNIAESCGGAIFFYNTTNNNNFTGYFTKNSALGKVSETVGNGGAITFKDVSTNCIFNCEFINNTAALNGGAVNYRQTPHNITFNCSFIGNNAPRGGGVNFFESFENVIFNGEFINNSAVNGGAIAAGAGSIKEVSFKDNRAENGGAVYFSSSSGTVEDCNFANNKANYGGAVYCNGNGSMVSSCNFTNNSAKFGGAIYFKSAGTVNNCDFEENTVERVEFNARDGFGGAIYFASDGEVFNSTFYKNQANGNGSWDNNEEIWIYTKGGAIYISGNGVISNSKFYKNEANTGSAIFSGMSTLEVSNSEFIANKGRYGRVSSWKFTFPDYIAAIFDCQNNYINAIYKQPGKNITLSNVTYWNGEIVNTDDGYPIREFLGIPFNLSIRGCDGNIYYNALYIPNGTNRMPYDLSLASYPNGDITIGVYHKEDDYFEECNNTVTLDMSLYSRSDSSVSINTAESEFVYGNCYINFATENTCGYYIVITDEDGKIVYEKINKSGGINPSNDPLISLTYDGQDYNELIFVDLPAGCYNITVYGLGSFTVRGGSDSKLFRILPLDSTISVDAVSEIIYNNPINVEISGENLTTVNVTVYDSDKNIVFSQNTTESAITIPVLPVGTYNITAVNYGNENITGCEDSIIINVLKASNNVIVSVDDVSYGDDAIVVITADKSGEYTVNINGTVKTVDVVNGAGNTSISLNAGYYWVNASFDNPNYESIITNDTFNVLKATTDIAAIDMATAHDVDRYIVITLEDNRGNPISGAEVTVELGGQNKYATDSNGQVKAPISGLDEGKYTANITFAGNENYLGSNTTVNVTITDGTTFYDLNRIINDNNDAEIILSNDYAYNPYFDSDFINGVEIAREVTVDGNGHTIDGLHIARIFNITGNNVILKNINFINGTASNGGAIYCDGDGFTINNCNFTNNNAKRKVGGNHLDDCNVKIYGGSIYCSGDDFTINNCVFTGNSAKSEGYANYLSDVTIDIGGGAIYCCGNDFTINNCSFTSNSVRGDGIANGASAHTKLVDIGGGAVYCRGDNLLIHDSNFINNSVVNNFAKFKFSTSCAGAIYCLGDNLTIYDCIFINNSAFAEDTSDYSGSGGGAVYCLGDNFSVYDCNFINNSAFVNTFVMSTRSDGGAIYWSGNILSIHDCNFTNNTAIDNGGAIFCNGNDYTITHCNFANNTGKSGGGIYCNGNGFPISDCIFINNTALARDESNGGGAIYFYMGGTVNNCEFEGNRALPSITDFYDAYGGAIYFASNGNVFNSTFYKNNAIARWYHSGYYDGKDYMIGGGAIYIVGNGVINNSKFYKQEAKRGSAILSGNKTLEIRNSEFISNKGILAGQLSYTLSLPSSIDFNLDCSNNYINAIYKYSGNIVLSNVTYWNGQIVNTDDGYPITYYLGIPFNLSIIGCDGNKYYDVLYMPNATYIIPFDVGTANYPNGPITFTISPTAEDYCVGEISLTIDNDRMTNRNPTCTNITTSENEFVYGNCYINFTTGKTEGYYIVITNENGDVVYEKKYLKVEDPEFNPLINPIQNGYDFNERIFVDLPAGLYNITVYGLGSFVIRGSSDSKLFRILPLDSTISVGATEISLPFNDTVNVNAALDPADAGTLIYSSSNSSIVTVDADGNVHAVGVGKANVTVSLADNGVYAAESKVVSVDVTSIDLNWHYLDNLEWLNLDGAAITTPWNDFPKTSTYGSLPIGYEITIQLNDSNIIKSYVKDSEGNFDVNLTGVSPGTYTATFSAYGYAGAVAAVSVTQVDAEIIIANATFDLKVNDEVAVGASLIPADAGNLTFTSSDESVAVVEDGLIRALGAGTATITVSFAGDGTYAAADKTIAVTVTKSDLTLTIPEIAVYNSTNKLVATLKDTDGNPVSDFKVKLVAGELAKIGRTDANGEISMDVSSLEPGKYTVGARSQITNAYNEAKVYAIGYVKEGKVDATLTIPDVVVIGDTTGAAVVATLKDEFDNILKGVKVKIVVGSLSKIAKTNKNGQVSIDISSLEPGEYKISSRSAVTDIYNEAKAKAKAIISEDKLDTTLTVPDVFTVYNSTQGFAVATLKDAYGNAVSGVKVNLTVANLSSVVETDVNGQVSLDISSLEPGEYNISAISEETDFYKKSDDVVAVAVVSADKITPTMTIPDVEIQQGDEGAVAVATLTDENGNVITGLKVKIVVGTLSKIARTDANGQVSLDISSLESGEYKIAARSAITDIFNEAKVKAKATIRGVIYIHAD